MDSKKRILVVCTTDSMIWNFLIPHIKNLERKGYHVECACSETGFFFHDLEEKYGIIMNNISFVRSPYSLKNLKAYNQLDSLIKEKSFGIIFCHEPVGGALGRLAGHKNNRTIIYMAHGFHFYKGAPKFNRIYYYVEKHLAKMTDVLVTMNKEDYEASLCFNAKTNVLIHGIGVDTSRFIIDSSNCTLRTTYEIDDDSLILLSVGELIPRKNHEIVIKSIYKLNNKKIYYFIAGNGKLYTKLNKMISALHLEKQVFLLGYRKDIKDLCNSSDLFIFPSIHEGLPLALMEAMSCGKPVICSKIRGNVDLIDEKGGICVTNNIEEYCSAIDFFCKNKHLLTSMGNYNKEKVKSFDIKIVEREISDIFESL